MQSSLQENVTDVVIIGSGFGGAPAALRLTEKGHKVVIIEKGKEWKDEDLPKSNWNLRKYLWMPALDFHGILHIDLFRNVMALHGSGVGGGSLVFGNVLVEPSNSIYASPAWSKFQNWKEILFPHFATAKRMLGVTPNPRCTPADSVMMEIARDLGKSETFSMAPVGVFFGKEEMTVPDPYFGGSGPARTGCSYCGACMVGCRTGAKNTLVKNYLYLARKLGAEVWAEQEVCDVRPLSEGEKDGARYEVYYRNSTHWLQRKHVIRTRNVVFSASTLGTMRLLFRCRDVTGSLSRISQKLGSMVRTNSEALLGSTARTRGVDYSKGIAITSLFHPDDVTTVEPVRFPSGSSSMRTLSGPVISAGGTFWSKLTRVGMKILAHPIDFAKTHVLPNWAERTTILLVMQTVESSLRFRLGRSILTLWRRDLISEPNTDGVAVGRISIAHKVMSMFAEKTNGIPAESWNEALGDVPTTAHILGGVPFGKDANDGVIGLNFEIHNYPGLYVVDGSVVPANPGFNPSLTITALSEYFASLFPQKGA